MHYLVLAHCVQISRKEQKMQLITIMMCDKNKYVHAFSL